MLHSLGWPQNVPARKVTPPGTTDILELPGIYSKFIFIETWRAEVTFQGDTDY